MQYPKTEETPTMSHQAFVKQEESIEELVMRATDNFTKILSTNEIKNKYPKLYWGGNGVGDRWANKKYYVN